MPGEKRGEEREENEKPPEEGLMKKLAKSRLFKTFVVAGAMHAPLQKDVGEALGRAEHATVESMKSPWEREHMVLEPQSAEDRATVRARIADREKRADRGAIDAYKADAERKMEAGEPQSFKKLQFDLERLGGVPPAEVDAAEKKADALIKKYVEQVGGKLDEQKLRQISIEMYGSDKSYVWGQASMTRYFNNGERNCVAISRAQGVVLEGVVGSLPLEERKRWRQGTQIEKQHEIAVIEHFDENGKRDVVYLLEGNATRKWVGAENEAGTALLPMDSVKKALVSGAPVVVNAARGEVKNSPDLAIQTDEPAALNVQVEGPLKGAEFNVREAKREGVEPRALTEKEIAAQRAISEEQEKRLQKEKVMEIEVNTEVGPEEIRQRLERAPLRDVIIPWPDTSWTKVAVVLDATDLESPSVEVVRETGRMKPGAGVPTWRVNFGSMEKWSPEAVRQALQNSTQGIGVQMKADGRLAENFLEEYEALGQEDRAKPGPMMVRIEDSLNLKEPRDIHPRDLRALLSPKTVKVIDLRAIRMSNVAAISEVIHYMPANKIVIMPRDVPVGWVLEPATYSMLSKTKGKVMLPWNVYGVTAARYPEILDNEHFMIDAYASDEDLTTLFHIIEGISPAHRKLKEIISFDLSTEHLPEIVDEQEHIDPKKVMKLPPVSLNDAMEAEKKSKE